MTRRQVIGNLSLAPGLSAALSWDRARGAQPARLDVKDPAYVQGSNCENCLQLQGSAGDNYRPCGIFPGKLVSVSGWCTAWTPEI
jgi:hypothetical protein